MSAMVHFRPLVSAVAAAVGFVRGLFPAALRWLLMDRCAVCATACAPRPTRHVSLHLTPHALLNP
jgi:hypothetical protein